jgi:hypothetical protein
MDSEPARTWSGHLGPVALLVGVTGFFCSGIVAHPLTHTLVFGGDGFVTFWNYWWARQSLVTLEANPLHTTYLTYPHDASLVFHSHDLLHGVLTMPIQLLVPGIGGLTLGVNLILFGCFLGAVLAMYGSTWALTHHRLAAVVAGFGYAFSPLHVTWLSMPVVGAVYWLPLFSWLFLRAVRRRRYAWLLPGLCFGLCTFQSLYYTLFLGFLAAFLSLFVLWSERDRARLLRRVLVLDAAIVVAGLPMAAVVVNDLVRTTYESPPEAVSAEIDCRTSLDLAGLVIPGPEQGLWRPVARPLNAYLQRPTSRWPLFGQNGVGGAGVYIGIVPLLLVAYAWGSGRRRAMIGWSAFALACVALALGPNLHIGGHIFRSAWLPLPYRLSRLGPPFFSGLFREPWLFYAPALFAIWTLAALGLSRLAGPRRRHVILVRALVLAWLVLDYAAPPFATAPVHVPAVYAGIARDPRPLAIYDVPVRSFFSLEYYAFLQTVHGKPIARGYMARPNSAATQRDELLQQAAQLPRAFDALLNDLGPAYVIVHKVPLMQPAERWFAAAIAQRLPKTYDDAELAVYAWRLSP